MSGPELLLIGGLFALGFAAAAFVVSIAVAVLDRAGLIDHG